MSNIPKQENRFFVLVSVILLIIGITFVIMGIIKEEIGSALFGLTSIYESLNVYQGKVPTQNTKE